jgi:replication factor C subunit 3/5
MSGLLLVDRVRPTKLENLSYNTDITQLLTRLSSTDCKKDLPHLLVYGPPGAGKKTRVLCLLNELYGPGKN